jgi:formylmethanofuran dehydrogenase subunit B
VADLPATCAGCGCACDDIEVTVADGALQRVHRTCALGDAWFAERAAASGPAARVGGREADVDDAIAEAVAILSRARFPLVCGLGRTDVESQRAAVALADAAGAVIDAVGPPGDGEAGAAAHAFGLSTASFGDVRDRAEIVVAWRADPVTTHPRLLPRLRLTRADRGSGPRDLVVIDAQRTATAEEADTFIELPAERDFDALWAMRALVREIPLDRELAASLPLDALGDLAGRLKGCEYGALLHGMGLAAGPGGEIDALALHALVRDLGRETHVVSLPLRHDANARGADDVLAWQTGYPAAVSLARGHPRARRGELSAAALLERGEPDAALVVGPGALDHLTPGAAEHLRRIPTIVIGPRAAEHGDVARVALATAASGVHREGIAHRMDGVPIPLRAPLQSPLPGDADVLAAIAERIAGGEEA